MLPKWTRPNNSNLGTINERQGYSIPLPLSTTFGLSSSVISGFLPPGMRLENNFILGTPFEVAKKTTFTFVVRARTTSGISDKTFTLDVEGSDAPNWITLGGILPVGANQAYFILDNSLIDFQLLATDNDLPAGDNLEYFIADNEGELPPGIQLTTDGRLVGLVEPLLSLEFNAGNGYYDTTRFDESYYDYGADFDETNNVPKKINRNYEFIVTVADNEITVKRKFLVYVVGDDFVRSDNSIMKAANGIFTADVTYLRNPIWITPANLGTKRANNYVTLFLEVLTTTTLQGNIKYILEPINPDGSTSRLPEGMIIDENTGEIAGRVPYQPAVTETYTFTVTAARAEKDTDVVTVFGTYLEDYVSGSQIIKIAKLNETDAKRLQGSQIVIENAYYNIDFVNTSSSDYDLIFLKTGLAPTKDASILEVTQLAIIGENNIFVKSLDPNQREFYLGKTFNYGPTFNFTIEDIFPYVVFEISSDTALQSSTGQDLKSYLELQLRYNTRFAFVESLNSSTIRVNIPDTSNNRSASILSSYFANTDIKIKEIRKQEKILINNNLQNELLQGQQFSLGVVAKNSFRKSFVINTDEVVQKAKTFTIKVRGEVDTTIEWITPDLLGDIKANRPSTLRLEAENILDQELLKYRIIEGELPIGLSLKDNGEIIGKVPIYETDQSLGLTFFDNSATLFDGGTTTFDREYNFTVEAKDRFGFSAIIRVFNLIVDDADNKNYSNLFMKPYLTKAQRIEFLRLMGNAEIVDPQLLYRPSDFQFGIQKELRSLAFGGIESKSITDFVKATTTNHKKRVFNIGEIKTAVAKEPGTDRIIYEVVYLELVDKYTSENGKTPKYILTPYGKKLTVDSLAFEEKDTTLPYDSSWRFRPINGNTITTDNVDITTTQGSANSKYYLSGIDNMRDKIRTIGASSVDFVPLWMRTAQGSDLAELGYTLAVPLVYTIEGGSEIIRKRMLAKSYDFKFIKYEIDRYIIDSTENNNYEQYIIFADYSYNV